MREVRLKCVWWECSLGGLPGSGVAGSSVLGILTCAHLCAPQNIMPLSAAMFLSERKNPTPQCPPRLEVQMLMPVSWSRMPNHFLQVETRRAGGRAARLGSAVPGAAHHDGAAHPRGEPVRASSGAQGWGGYLKPSGVWIPLGTPSPLPLGLQMTPQEAPGHPIFRR